MSSSARAAAAAAVLAALVPVGLWEGGRWESREERGMDEVRAAIGRLDSPSLAGYRVRPDFDCLVYRRGSNPVALELCVDSDGRAVEAIDRRAPERRIFSLRADPDASGVRVQRQQIDELLRRMGAPGGESGGG